LIDRLIGRRNIVAAYIIRLLRVPILVLVLVTSCGVYGDDTEPMPTGAPAGRAASPAAEARTVQVSLIEYAIEMPTSLPPGPTVFVVTNNGSMEHNFEVEG
jgi:hypothetical protein